MESAKAEHNKAAYEGFAELYLNNGKPREFGELVRNPELADTLESVAKIDRKTAKEYAPTEGIEAKEYRGCTSHFSVMDEAGNVFVQTQAIRNWWGCGVVIPGRGFIMNNTMADFSPKAGVRTTQGLAYGMANAVRPGKTPHICCLTKEQGLELEGDFSPDTKALLEDKGHHIKETTDFGVLLVMPNGIMKKDG